MSLISNGRPQRPPEPGYVQFLDADGTLRPAVDAPTITDERLLAIYEDMVLARHFDRRAVSLQRQGRISTYAPLVGHEAAQVASAHALREGDWLYPTYRDHAAKYVHGVDLARLLETMAGHPGGHRTAEGVTVVPETIPIATQIPQAVGTAWAAKRAGDDVVLCYFGDGATSEGDFHEGLNFAGVFDVPVVLFCINNQWAISTPRERQTTSDTIAGKAFAYGLDGVQVDGRDPLAVHEVTRLAIEKARSPGADESRPTLVEAVTYREGAHSTADDPSVYRDEVPAEWRDRDALARYEQYLRDRGLLDDTSVAAIEDRVADEVAAAIHCSERATEGPDDLFEHVYAELPPGLVRQRDELRRYLERSGERPD